MSWAEQKQRFEQQKSVLDELTSDARIDSLVDQLNTNLKEFTNRAGVSPSTPGQNQFQQAAEGKFVQLAEYQEQYNQLNKGISAYIQNQTASTDIQNKLVQVGQLQDDIAKAENALRDAKQDAETSKTRQSTVQYPEQNLSWYQGFSGMIGFTKPLKLTSIPFLIGFGILFLFFSGLILKDFFAPSAGYASDLSSYSSTFSVFTDARFYSVLAGITFVSVLVGILAWQGYLGKRI
jgi:hypothetical protein